MTDNFDWHKERLNRSTIITPSYKNTQNVRRFFRNEIGEHFHFTRYFMQFLKTNKGITLGEAVEEWKKQNGGGE